MTNHADWAARLDDGQPVLVTGAAGFIGFFLAEKLLRAGLKVVGIDNLNPYYDPKLKQARLDLLSQYPGFTFQKLDLADRAGMAALFDRHGFRHVVNLAAQAGVRHSIEKPHAYAESNLIGFLNILEECRRTQVAHLVYASSSSVYGGNSKLPFSVHDSVDHPVSFYAATKKANELMAHAGDRAAVLHRLRAVGAARHGDLHFHQGIAGGPADQCLQSRPDAARLHLCGRHRRGRGAAAPDGPGPEDMIAILEELTGREAVKEYLDMQPGDVPATFADVADLEGTVGFHPNTPLREGLTQFVNWYRAYYRF
jgi:UDP-glucuronate 4-epimerase